MLYLIVIFNCWINLLFLGVMIFVLISLFVLVLWMSLIKFLVFCVVKVLGMCVKFSLLILKDIFCFLVLILFIFVLVICGLVNII